MKKLMLAGLIAVTLLAFALNHFAKNSLHPMCKLRFGSNENYEPLLGVSNGSLLIYRNGDSDSSPESHPMSDGRLVDGHSIEPFEVDNKKYTISQCIEYKDDDPMSRHALMIWMNVENGDSTLSKYCDVKLLPAKNGLEIADFDAPLTIAQQTFNFVPDKLNFHVDGEPTDVRVCVGSVDKEIGSWVMVETTDGDQCRYPEDVRPTATIEFPADGGTTITRTYVLDQFC
ncbi:hypothetical protein OAG71_00610 [bacterium]|nr:hypothetical protein [bacterium]